MFDEYPDLIYEGIIYDLYNSYEFIEEGFSPKSIFKNILDILRRLGVRIRQFAISIKNKFMSLIHKIKNIITKNKNKKSEDAESENTTYSGDSGYNRNAKNERKRKLSGRYKQSEPNTEDEEIQDNNVNKDRTEEIKTQNIINKEDNKYKEIKKEEPKKNENQIEDYNWEEFVDNLIKVEDTYIHKDKDIDNINQHLYSLEGVLMRFADESNMGRHIYTVSGTGKNYKDENNEILNKALGYRQKIDVNIKICKDSLQNLQDRPVYKSTEEFLNFVQGKKRPIVLNKETKENFNRVMEEVDSKMPKVVSSCSVSLRNEQEYLDNTVKMFEKIQEQVEHDDLPESFVKYFLNIKDIICKKYTLDLKLYNNILQSFSVNFMQSIKIYEKIS